jgi:hypothetical protein
MKFPREFCWFKSRLSINIMPSNEDSSENCFGGKEKKHDANGLVQLPPLHELLLPEFFNEFPQLLPVSLMMPFLSILLTSSL